MSLSTSALAASRYDAVGYAPTPDMISAAEFALWPEAMQVDLVRSYGAGRPAMALIGTGATAAIATLSANDGTVDLTAVPAGFDRDPRDLAVSDFARWPNAAQILYVATNGAGGAMDIGPSGASLRVSIARDFAGQATDVEGMASAGLLEADAPVLSIAPGALSAGSLFALTTDEQFTYASRYSSGTPPTISLAGAGSTGVAITLGSEGRTFVVRVPATAYPGFSTPVTGQTSAVTGFDAWPPAVRSAYLEAQQPGAAYPKALVFGSTIWSVAARGADAESVAVPAGFSTPPASLDAATFVRWPQAAQVAYLRANLAGPGDPVSIGTSPTVTATLAAASPSLRLASAATPSTLPASLALDLFQLWPEADRAAYLEQYGTGTPKSIDVAATSGHPRTLIAASEDGRVVTSLVPTGFATSPVTLSPATFLSWPSALRELYAATQLATSPASLAPTTFLGWQPFFRDRYVAANLAGGATSLTIGGTTDSIAASVTGGQLRLAPSSTPPIVVTFRALPEADRLAYLNANGTGTPKTIEVPAATSPAQSRTLIYLDSGGSVATTAFPSTYPAASSTDAVRPDRFLAWPQIFQARFAAAHLDAGQSYATIGAPGPERIRATPLGGTVTISVAAADFDRDNFILWPAADRIAYLNANGTGTPKGILVDGGDDLLTVGADGAVSTRTVPGDYDRPPTDLNPASFLQWEPIFQQRYLAEKLVPPATRLTIGAGLSTIDLTRQQDGSFRVSTSPSRFNVNIFERWPASDRLAYFNAYAAGSPRALDTVASSAQARTLVTVSSAGVVGSTAFPAGYPSDGTPAYPSVYLGWSSDFRARYEAERAGRPLVATGETSPRPATTSAATFAAWPLALQIAFVNQYGRGTPPAVLIGTSGAQSIVRLTREGKEVDLAPAPSGIATPPASLAVDTFLGWSLAARVFYVENYAQNGRIGPSTGQLSVEIEEDRGIPIGIRTVADADLKTANAAIFGTLPASLTPARFFSLSPDEQLRYFELNRGGSPQAIRLNGATSSDLAITVKSRNESFLVYVTAATYPGFGTTLSTLQSAVPAATFQSWPPAVQAAYVVARSPTDYPKIVTFGANSSTLAMVRSAEAEVEIVSYPAGLPLLPALLPSGTTAAQFVAMPEAYQIAGIRQYRATTDNSVTVFPATTTATLGPGHAEYTVQIATRPPYVTLATLATPATLPANLDLTMFALWPATDQAAYVTTRGTGTPKAVIVPADTPTSRPRTILTIDERGRVAARTFPTDYAKAPGTLKPLEFQGLEPIFQALYVQENRAAGAASVVIGPVGNQVTVSPSGAGGVFVQEDVNALTVPVTLGQTLEIPYHYLLGSDVGLNPNPNGANAETLFPTLDGTAGHTIAVKPPAVAAEFGKGPTVLTAEAFNSWHTAFQLEYLRREMAVTNPPASSITIGAAGNQLTAFISSTGTKVYIAENLQKQDIAKMTLADQEKLAGLSAFTSATGIGARLQLVSGALGLAEVTRMVTDVRSKIAGPQYDDANLATYSPGGNGQVPNADKLVFYDQLDNIAATFANMKVFSTEQIGKQIQEISERFDRVNAFAVNLFRTDSQDPAREFDAQPGRFDTTSQSDLSTTLIAGYNDVSLAYILVDNVQVTLKAFFEAELTRLGTKSGNTSSSIQQVNFGANNPSKPTVYLRSDTSSNFSVTSINYATFTIPAISRRYVSTDNNAKIQQGYDLFMAQERQLLSLQDSRQALAQSGMLQNRALDVPNLVYLFQLYSNLSGEAKIRIASEEIEQINALLKTYSIMQKLINNTVAAYTGTDTTVTRTMVGSKSGGGFTDEEDDVRAMFNVSSTSAGAKHPMEALLGFSRPTLDVNGSKQSSFWQQASTSVGDKVTLINQESQIKMNEVNSMTKQKDRNFDLANNALSKMSEVLQKIASLA